MRSTDTWNHFGCSGINADVLKATADQFVALGLDKLGYEYDLLKHFAQLMHTASSP